MDDDKFISDDISITENVNNDTDNRIDIENPFEKEQKAIRFLKDEFDLFKHEDLALNNYKGFIVELIEEGAIQASLIIKKKIEKEEKILMISKIIPERLIYVYYASTRMKSYLNVFYVLLQPLAGI